MGRQTLCILSTDNLLHNLAVIKAKAPRAKIMAMIKANAYGHGLRSVAHRLQERVEELGVATIDEAMALRQAGIKTPITLIEGVFTSDELPLAAIEEFSVVLHNEQQLEWLATMQLPKKINAWLKINTGLGRLGFSPDVAKKILQFMSASTMIKQPFGLMSHFACADQPNHPLNQKQINTFCELAGTYQGPRNFCNSAAIWAFPDMHYEWVRPGLALYGAAPFAGQTAENFDLKPVMTFETEIIATQKLLSGDTVGYDALFTCPEDMIVGIIAVGYGDGYPRSMFRGGYVRVNNTNCSVIGRVSMDMTAIDLRPCPGAVRGDRVILWGEGLPVETLAAKSDHSSYDLLTGVQNRVKFIWQ